jgi:hypothetical protein
VSDNIVIVYGFAFLLATGQLTVVTSLIQSDIDAASVNTWMHLVLITLISGLATMLRRSKLWKRAEQDIEKEAEK